MSLPVRDNALTPINRATGFCTQNSSQKPFGSLRLRTVLTAAFVSSALVALPALAPLNADMAFAQELPTEPRDPNAQLLLKADELVYDNDNQAVTAIGNVQLDYDGYNVVAERVTYDQKTRRVKASGNVEILEPNGNRIYADEIDITDDFGEGFVNALRVETTDNTRFAAESAERFADQKTVFNHGVYTACEPCKDRPDRAPLWQVKASKVILDGKSKTVTYTNARFEFFGLPIAYFPYFSHADPSVKRKSGFLIPSIGMRSDLGAFYRQSYFLVTGDTHDLTFSGTYFSQQGFLAEAEWRQQFNNGQYNIRAAGIDQHGRSEFSKAPDSVEFERGMVSTSGLFSFNPRWQFGWNLMSQSDATFSNTYNIKGYSAATFQNDLFLRGIGGKSYFDLSGYNYQNQGNSFFVEDRQAFVRPVLDYNLVKDESYLGGEISLDVNATSLERKDLYRQRINTSTGQVVNTFGGDGDSTRVTADLQWKKTYVTDGGLTVTPFLGVRGDFINSDIEVDAFSPAVENGNTSQFMPKAGVELSYPILARTETSSHVFEPIVQVLLRPDLTNEGILPNEDAQGLEFDATNLFSHDKFTGYDRIESGSRANVGIRYSGIFDNGLALNATFGQSYVLGGENPFTKQDLVNVGADSGLDKDRSDYVASVGMQSRFGVRFNTKARFDSSDFDIQRGEAQVAYSNSLFNLSTSYIYIAPQPELGVENDRQQIALVGGVKFYEGWKAFGSAYYDIENSTLFRKSVGVSYNDECFSLSLAFTEIDSRYDDGGDPKQTLTFRVGIRTIGDIQESVSVADTFGEGGFLDQL